MSMSSSKNMTPREIVNYLDKYIVGQTGAKKTIAIALRNRWRRLQLNSEMQERGYPLKIILNDLVAQVLEKPEIAKTGFSRMMRFAF